MDLGLLALFLHCMHATYIQMSQSRYVKFENRDMSKFSCRSGLILIGRKKLRQSCNFHVYFALWFLICMTQINIVQGVHTKFPFLIEWAKICFSFNSQLCIAIWVKFWALTCIGCRKVNLGKFDKHSQSCKQLAHKADLNFCHACRVDHLEDEVSR